MLPVVTGAYGLVGGMLVGALLERGDRVRAADKRRTESEAARNGTMQAIGYFRFSRYCAQTLGIIFVLRVLRVPC
jgi:nucleoside-diphosphate-sugar epimerase